MVSEKQEVVRPVDSTGLFQGDSMLKHFWEAYQEEGAPDRRELKKVVHFLANFSIGCRRLGCDAQAEKYGDRLALYLVMLKRFGFREGAYRSGYKVEGLTDILENVLQVRLQDEDRYRR